MAGSKLLWLTVALLLASAMASQVEDEDAVVSDAVEELLETLNVDEEDIEEAPEEAPEPFAPWHDVEVSELEDKADKVQEEAETALHQAAEEEADVETDKPEHAPTAEVVEVEEEVSNHKRLDDGAARVVHPEELKDAVKDFKWRLGFYMLKCKKPAPKKCEAIHIQKATEQIVGSGGLFRVEIKCDGKIYQVITKRLIQSHYSVFPKSLPASYKGRGKKLRGLAARGAAAALRKARKGRKAETDLLDDDEKLLPDDSADALSGDDDVEENESAAPKDDDVDLLGDDNMLGSEADAASSDDLLDGSDPLDSLLNIDEADADEHDVDEHETLHDDAASEIEGQEEEDDNADIEVNEAGTFSPNMLSMYRTAVHLGRSAGGDHCGLFCRMRRQMRIDRGSYKLTDPIKTRRWHILSIKPNPCTGAKLAATFEAAMEINEQNLGWTADVPSKFAGKTKEEARKFLGMIPVDVDEERVVDPLAKLTSKQRRNMPKHYDARDKHFKCRAFTQILDQKSCGSCYAFAAASAFGARLCARTAGNIDAIPSPQESMDCTRGCTGGNAYMVYDHYKKSGIVDRKCDPYTGTKVACGTSCKNAAKYKVDDFYTVKGVDAMKAELLLNGPCYGGLKIYSDFFQYNQGIYRKSASAREEGGHAVMFYGFGEDTNGVPYWKIQNSWGHWGEAGLGKIHMGSNQGNLEAWGFTCAKPAMSTTGCNNGFCPICKNGGRPLTNGKCECQTGFTGTTCNVCSLKCQNGGVLDKGLCSCSCPVGTSGNDCSVVARISNPITCPGQSSKFEWKNKEMTKGTFVGIYPSTTTHPITNGKQVRMSANAWLCGQKSAYTKQSPNCPKSGTAPFRAPKTGLYKMWWWRYGGKNEFDGADRGYQISPKPLSQPLLVTKDCKPATLEAAKKEFENNLKTDEQERQRDLALARQIAQGRQAIVDQWKGNPNPSPAPPAPKPRPITIPSPSPPSPGPAPRPSPGPAPRPSPSPGPAPRPSPGPAPRPSPSPGPAPRPSPGPAPAPGNGNGCQPVVRMSGSRNCVVSLGQCASSVKAVFKCEGYKTTGRTYTLTYTLTRGPQSATVPCDKCYLPSGPSPAPAPAPAPTPSGPCGLTASSQGGQCKVSNSCPYDRGTQQRTIQCVNYKGQKGTWRLTVKMRGVQSKGYPCESCSL